MVKFQAFVRKLELRTRAPLFKDIKRFVARESEIVIIMMVKFCIFKNNIRREISNKLSLSLFITACLARLNRACEPRGQTGNDTISKFSSRGMTKFYFEK